MPDDRPILLVLRALDLGDLLVAVPALRALRRARPDHRLVLATPALLAPLAMRTGAVDEVLDTPYPGWLRWPGPAPDIAVNLHDGGPQSHRVLDSIGARARIGFAASGWPGPPWVDAEEVHERVRWCAMLADHGIPADPDDLYLDRPVPEPGPAPVVVHPGAETGAKRWPVARFADVVADLHGQGRQVLLTGSADERPLALDVARAAGLSLVRVLAGRTTVAELCDLVARAALVVSGDTGVAHLATALRVPSVVLFGPVPPERSGPPAGGSHVVLSDAGARRGDPLADDPDPALLGVSVPDVLAAADSLLRRR
ncbi:glycosyltransferase family 9 protein [Pseudonocardia sp.]|uniref:glycosyltransferase family 9 protein n=1 Tax=Pseudonocardia sp. TaxID=60912 RepID=UPI002620F66A|nr:glycosyltransferase family 9 protein [Pseudonocardia sp.]